MRLLILSALMSSAAFAAPDARQVNYAPPGGWVLPPPVPEEGASQPDAPLRVIYNDEQVRIGPWGEERFVARRIRLQKPEALSIGDLALGWDPAAGTATVHRLHIVRDGETIDLLRKQRFTVLRREEGLEAAMLDGWLTATLQVKGLQVGDELDFAYTIGARDPTLRDRAFGRTMLALEGMPGVFRFRLSWPETDSLRWRATRDLAQAAPVREGGRLSLAYELRNPTAVTYNMGAPSRFNIPRSIEYSDFSGWDGVSQLVADLFRKAEILAPDSPLRAETARIAAASANPKQRAEAALRLVQEQIRYFYVGLDGANLRPATADETWHRRFGDCKAKTVLLLALLHALGIEAEPALVNLFGDDGLDQRLPSPGLFNHVLVRATIDGRHYWLDGTRDKDRRLELLPPPSFRWALPLREKGGALEAVPVEYPEQPQFVGVLRIDASAGFDRPAKVEADNVLRRDAAAWLQAALSQQSAVDVERTLKGYWSRRYAWIDPDAVSWRYDDQRGVLTLSLRGEGKLEWRGDDVEGRRWYIPDASFPAPPLRRRPKDQDQNAPWLIGPPAFTCSATSIRLPASAEPWRWTYDAVPMSGTTGGIAYWRASSLTGGVMRAIVSVRIVKTEIDSAEARDANAQIPDFNNRVSRVYQYKAPAPRPVSPSEANAFDDKTDWTGNVPACSAPRP